MNEENTYCGMFYDLPKLPKVIFKNLTIIQSIDPYWSPRVQEAGSKCVVRSTTADSIKRKALCYRRRRSAWGVRCQLWKWLTRGPNQREALATNVRFPSGHDYGEPCTEGVVSIACYERISRQELRPRPNRAIWVTSRTLYWTEQRVNLFDFVDMVWIFDFAFKPWQSWVE